VPSLTTTFIDERTELLGGVYDEERATQVRALLHLYNRTLGPVSALTMMCPDILDLSIYSANCSHHPIGSLLRDLTVKADPYRRQYPGGGKGAQMAIAALGALGEMGERLLAALHFGTAAGQIVYATHRELTRHGRQALGPERLALFAPEQFERPRFGYVPFRSDQLLGWVEGIELLTGHSVLVPAQLVLMYYRMHPQEAPIGFTTSAGLAFHTSRRRAILHGLYEVVERDAVNVHWYCRLAPGRVEVDLEQLMALHVNVRQARVSTPQIKPGVQLFLHRLDLPIPVFTALAIDRTRRQRAFRGGSGASPRRQEGLMQALGEVGQGANAFRFADPFGRNPVYADSDVSELTEFFDAPLYYGHAGNLHKLRWYREGGGSLLWEDVPTTEFDDEQQEFDTVMTWLREAEMSPIVFDFGSACPRGTHVTKVLVPQLTQACTPSHPFLGHGRFYKLPLRIGMADRVLTFADLNGDPVPFP
jgi:ribosomal protein S12 methylthiotransferase accessory factor